MDEGLQKAVIKTITYSDIFDYPLRVSELHQYLIGLQVDNSLRFTSLFDADKRGLTQIGERNGYFFLQGREKIVGLRRKREKISQEKMQKAKEVLNVLRHIPFIKMIAVTGAVAAGNAGENSDIDVLIVTQKDRFWLARLLAIFLMELRGVRRRPGSTSSKKDKFCLNMFISEENLELPNKDLFTANEFARMKLVWEKDNTYQRFIETNKWVQNYLPNWTAHNAEITNSKHQVPSKHQIQSTKFQSASWRTKFKAPSSKFFDILDLRFGIYLLFGILNLGFNWLEKFARIVQLKYMERRKTTELITNDLLMFHPQDARKWVMKEYEKRIKGLGIRD